MLRLVAVQVAASRRTTRSARRRLLELRARRRRELLPDGGAKREEGGGGRRGGDDKRAGQQPVLLLGVGEPAAQLSQRRGGRRLGGPVSGSEPSDGREGEAGDMAVCPSCSCCDGVTADFASRCLICAILCDLMSVVMTSARSSWMSRRTTVRQAGRPAVVTVDSTA
jgi:hypothetical protein